MLRNSRSRLANNAILKTALLGIFLVSIHSFSAYAQMSYSATVYTDYQ